MNAKAKYYIDKLQLIRHPEGGYFKEVYRSSEFIKAENLPLRYKSNRTFSTSIYFLLEGNEFSSLHKLKSDEIWHFYDGSPVKISIIDRDGILNEIVLGKNLKDGEIMQIVIEKNNWFGAELLDKESFCLVGCTVAPAFDFDDLKIGNRQELLKRFPQHKKIIERLTK